MTRVSSRENETIPKVMSPKKTIKAQSIYNGSSRWRRLYCDTGSTAR